MKIKKIVAMSAVVGVALTGLAFVSSASAEPVSNSYVLVGSDTLQDSTNALLNGTNASGSFVRLTANQATIGSFDAFGSTAIQAKPNGVFFGRPSGSGGGINALRASITGNLYSGNAAIPTKDITGQVDIARSSSGPGTNASPTAGQLLYVPYARDAVAYAYKGGTAAWANISSTQLKQIYDGTLHEIDGVAITPRLPQAGSGTRNFFLPAIGYAAGTTSAPGVPESATPENDASVLAAGEIIPFSVASWVAQANRVTGINSTTTAGVALGTPITGTLPFTGTVPALVPNASYYSNALFGRDTYLVVEYARVTTGNAKYDANLAALVDPDGDESLTNFAVSASSPGAVKKKFGFLSPSNQTALRAYPTL